ncbi:MAG: hypothetical protein ACK4VO_02485 [Pseudobdellovibrio sp.]
MHQQGSHFGKNKPDWHMTSIPFEMFRAKYGSKIRLLILGLFTQAIILFPIVYWSLQNYTFFENNIPAQYNLKNYINTEKNWIIILYTCSVVFSAFFNLYISSRTKRNSIPNTIDVETSLGEAVDQRHAS